jgi:hypothetical protein
MYGCEVNSASAGYTPAVSVCFDCGLYSDSAAVVLGSHTDGYEQFYHL